MTKLIKEPVIVNIYASQTASLLALNMPNIIQKEQRERVYWSEYIENNKKNNSISKLEIKGQLTKKADYVLIDKHDLKYNANLEFLAHKNIFINYGWDKNGKSRFGYKNKDFKWKYKNDLYKQFLYLSKNLSKAKLINFKEAKLIAKNQLKKNNKIIASATEKLQKYKNKNIAFVSHWQAKGQVFKKEHFEPNKIMIWPPGLIPFAYTNWKWKFPVINNHNIINRAYQSNGIFDLKQGLISAFQNKFDYIFYIENDVLKTTTSDRQIIKKMLVKNGQLKVLSHRKVGMTIKNLFEIPYFINELIIKIK